MDTTFNQTCSLNMFCGHLSAEALIIPYIAQHAPHSVII